MARPPSRSRAGVEPTRRESAQAGDADLDLGDVADSVGHVLRRAQLAVAEDFIRSLASLDLRPSQFRALLVIGRNPGLNQAQVSEALGIKRTNFVALVDELEQRGFARRLPVPNDRRSYALELTRAGEARLAAARRLQAEHERRLCDRLGPGGRDTLLKLLRSLVHPPGVGDATSGRSRR